MLHIDDAIDEWGAFMFTMVCIYLVMEMLI